MAHHASRLVYDRLTERLNRFPQGAPPARSLFQILKILFSDREAELVSVLPIRPFTAARAAGIWKVSEAEARATLEALAERALLVDWEGEAGTEYVLPPPMAGFFEFSMMRVRQDVDQQALAELFYQYLNVEEDFVRRSSPPGRPSSAAPSCRRRSSPRRTPSTSSTSSAPAR